jgi:transposase-like protein
VFEVGFRKKKLVAQSWMVDETYIKVKGEAYIYIELIRQVIQ